MERIDRSSATQSATDQLTPAPRHGFQGGAFAMRRAPGRIMITAMSKRLTKTEASAKKGGATL